jgi:thiol-disulfide isomerase/thioredoxin
MNNGSEKIGIDGRRASLVRIRNTIFGILAIHLSVAASRSQETPEQPVAPGSIHAKVESLSKEFAAKEKSLVSARVASQDPVMRRSLADEQLRLGADYAKKFLAVADLVPGQSLALEALHAAAIAEDRGPEVEIALERMRHDCASDPKIARLCHQLGYLPSAKVEPLLREILVRNPDRAAKGHACVTLARLLAFRAEFPKYRAQDPEMAKGLERHYDKSMLDELDRRDVAAMVVEAEVLYERVLSEFADVKLLPSDPNDARTIRPEAETWLAARRELAIGKLAPEIVGTNVDGKPLKLSDYRGKVVVLVFWASWCGPCMAQLPHEVALAKRLAGKPFAILGVNLDLTLAAARAAVEKANIPWPNWCDGDPKKPGPIFTLYRIQSVPVIYVLDNKGIIRAKDVHGETLDRCAEMLLGELK